jgi:hypothetical protein
MLAVLQSTRCFAFGGFIPAFNVESQFTETVKFESNNLAEHFKMGGLKKSVIRNMEL